MSEIQTAGQIEQMTYSVDDRMVEYHRLGAPGKVEEYSYDLYGRLINKVVDLTATNYYMYDGIVLLAELDGSKNLYRYYKFKSGSYFPLETNEVYEFAISTQVFHTDHIMSPILLTSELESIS